MICFSHTCFSRKQEGKGGERKKSNWHPRGLSKSRPERAAESLGKGRVVLGHFGVRRASPHWSWLYRSRSSHGGIPVSEPVALDLSPCPDASIFWSLQIPLNLFCQKQRPPPAPFTVKSCCEAPGADSAWLQKHQSLESSWEAAHL